MKKQVFSREVIALRNEGYTFQEIGELLEINKSTAHRLYKIGLERPNYWEHVGTKKRVSQRPFHPIWNHVPTRWFLWVVWYIAKVEKVDVDYLFDYAYTINLAGIEKPKAYLVACLKSRARDYRKSAEYRRVKSMGYYE